MEKMGDEYNFMNQYNMNHEEAYIMYMSGRCFYCLKEYNLLLHPTCADRFFNTQSSAMGFIHKLMRTKDARGKKLLSNYLTRNQKKLRLEK